MWETKESAGPVYIGMKKNEFTPIIGDNYYVFKRFEDDEDEVIAYNDISVHVLVDMESKIKRISVFRPMKVFWEGVQLLGRDIKIVLDELRLKGLRFLSVDAGVWNEETKILLVEVDGIVDGVEMGI